MVNNDSGIQILYCSNSVTCLPPQYPTGECLFLCVLESIYHLSQKVLQAVASALDLGPDILHEALFIKVELLNFAPVLGLVESC